MAGLVIVVTVFLVVLMVQCYNYSLSLKCNNHSLTVVNNKAIFLKINIPYLTIELLFQIRKLVILSSH